MLFLLLPICAQFESVVQVVEFSGTQTILVTSDAVETKDEKLETKGEPIINLKFLKGILYKQYEKLVTAVLLINSPAGIDCREEQPEKQL